MPVQEPRSREETHLAPGEEAEPETETQSGLLHWLVTMCLSGTCQPCGIGGSGRVVVRARYSRQSQKWMSSNKLSPVLMRSVWNKVLN